MYHSKATEQTVYHWSVCACMIKNKQGVIYDKTLEVEFWTLITWSEALLNGLCEIINVLLENKNKSTLSGL